MVALDDLAVREGHCDLPDTHSDPMRAHSSTQPPGKRNKVLARRALGALRAPSLVLACTALALVGCTSHGIRPSAGTTPEQWQSEQIAAMSLAQHIYDQAQIKPGLLAQDAFMRHEAHLHDSAAFKVISGQYLNWYDGYLGSYLHAERDFSIAQQASPNDAPSPLLRPMSWHAASALQAIPLLARSRRAIFLNEDHTAPMTRTLTVALLARLRAEGFNTFAAETLYQKGLPGLLRRGYATRGTGFYTEEPIYADMVRTALRLGYRVIAYEAPATAHIAAREADEAENLYRRGFVGNPDARLVVNAGFAHIQKHGIFLGGHSMAEDFMRISGIDPLSVEQTMLTGHLRRSYDLPDWRAVIAALHPAQPIVFLGSGNRAWSLHPGDYDVSVFFPRERILDGRPTWLGLWGLRYPVRVFGSTCKGQFPCLVEARHAGEDPRAIPADRIVFRCSREVRDLWLRPGRYRLSARNQADRVIDRQMLTARRTRLSGPGTPVSQYRSLTCDRHMQVFKIQR